MELVVAVCQGGRKLPEDLEHLIFRERSILLFALGHKRAQILALSPFHHDTERVVDDDCLLDPNDVRMLQLLEHRNLVLGGEHLGFWQAAQIDLLHHELALIAILFLHEEHQPEAPLADLTQLLPRAASTQHG